MLNGALILNALKFQARVAELADAGDLKSSAEKACEFESRPGHS